MTVTSTLAKLKNYFISWHTNNYDILHETTDQVTNQDPNSNKAVTSRAVYDYVLNPLNKKIGDSNNLPYENINETQYDKKNITYNIQQLNDKINLLNTNLTTITNNFNTHKNNDDTSHRHMTESEYWHSRIAAFYDSYDSTSVNSDGTPYYKWRRRGMWAILRTYGITIKSGLKTTQTYTLNYHNTRNQWTPALSTMGAFSYDEVKWVLITTNSTHPGWEIQYKPKSTSATQLYMSVVYLCADQYVRINDIPRKIYWKAATADHGAGYWIDGLGWAVDL